jgi:hypothetical protein
MLLRALIPTAAAAFVIAAPAQAAPVSVTYTTVGESVFVVPPGVHDVDVALTGAAGGSEFNGTGGGRGATVTGTLPVLPGDRLYAVVGGEGADFAGGGSWFSTAGGANGGGAGFNGGGGASDIRTAPFALAGSLSTRLAVAGGGGGAGYGAAYGGDAGAAGIDATGGAAGGHAGTLTAGGAGGIGVTGENGTAGSLGLGGDGMAPNTRGGGGGGGFYGGGGGAGEGPCRQCGHLGGGGGGSSLVPPGGRSGLAAAGEPAQVTIAYERAQPAVSASSLDFPSTLPGGLSASRRLELTNGARSTDLIVGALSLDSDDFIIGASSCSGAVTPGSKCAIAIRFAPSAAGSHTGTLAIDTNAGRQTITLRGDSPAPPAPSVAPAPTATTVTPGIAAPSAPTARVTCRKQRCSVAFSGDVPKLRSKRTRVRASLTRGGRVYARADFKARRGSLRLVLKTTRRVKPGTYTLKLKIGRKNSTRIAIA